MTPHPRRLGWFLTLLAFGAFGALGLWIARAPARSALREASSASPFAAPRTELANAEGLASPALPGRAAVEASLAKPASGAASVPAPSLPALVVTGRVVDTSERPIAGADVFLGNPWEGETRIAGTDASGGFSAALAERPREYAFCVVADGFEGARRFLASDVRGAELRLGTFRLGPGGEAHGRIVDEAGNALARAWVQWFPASAFPRDVEAARENGPEDEDDAQERFHAMGKSAADGTFRLRGLPPRACFVAALGGETSWGWTPLFTPGPGLPEQRIVLPPPRTRSTSIIGVVEDPEGTPLDGVVLRIATGAQHYDADVTSEGGRFVLHPHGTAPVRLVALDPRQRFASRHLDDVWPGARGLVLRMGPPEWLVVRIVDTEERAIPGGSVNLDGYPTAAGADDLVRVQRPREPFELAAWAPGFLARELKRLDPATLGAELVVALEPGPAVRGRVLAGGSSLGGARVALCLTSELTVVREARGLAPLDHPFQIAGSAVYDGAQATTDAAGRFVFSLGDERALLLRVEADGHPLTVFGPFAAERARATELALALEHAGALEGRVRTAPGSAPRERLVAASDGHGFAWTAPVQADGAYRIDGLAPGSYQVRPCEPPAASLQPLDEGPPACEPLEWDCAVRAGETTRFDLDLTGEESLVLVGELVLPGTESNRREAVLLPERAPPRSQGVRARAALDSDGRFELHLARPGDYVLEVRTGWLVLSEPVQLLPGRTEWRRSFETGRLHVRVPAAAELKAPHARLRYTAAESGHTRITAELDTYWSADVSFAVPAGKGRLELLPENAAENAWTLWRELAIAAGEEVLVVYP